MRELKPKRRARKLAGEEGYILLAVLFLVVMVLITLSIAAPKVAADIERDREVELVHRGQQYVRAVKLYYKKFGAYPPNLDALEKTNEIRFLRKRYKDPITGKDEWHLIHFGENKTPSMGFFGQPLSGTGGAAIAGVGPGGMGQSIGTPMGGGSSYGGSSFGNSSPGSSPFGGSSLGSSSIGSSPIGGTTDPNAGNAAGTAGTSGTGTNTGTGTTSGTGTDPNSTGGSTSSSGFGSSTGQTFGGGGVIGVESTSPKLAILVWKKKTHFNEWEFWYDPNADRQIVGGNAGTIGQPMSGAGNSGSSFGPSAPSSFGQPGNPPTGTPTTNAPTTQPQF